MKPYAYYKNNTLSYPSKDDYTTVYAYHRGSLLWSGRARAWPDAKKDLPPNYLVEQVVDEDAFKAARTAYGNETARLHEEFKRDLFELHGVTGHPKAERCYSLAYDKGHAYGFEEVAGYFDDFVDLIKD
jgi:hypothetical protein